ncbi:MAG TPA: Fis family transcriptional regulator, partial [Gammaproteobacteria bacterium]|nr:Fis family transcriptional regulator [Gammaproteobacteria bacterium]
MSLSTAPDAPPLTVVSSLPDQERRKKPLCDCVRSSLMLYLKDLNGHAPQKLHQMVMGEVERPLLEIVMKYVEGNQTKAS